MKKVIILILFAFLSSGCFNYRELNELAIVSGIGLDKKGDNLLITVQVINTVKPSADSASASNPKFIVFEAEGKTIQEASRKLILNSSKRIYAEHLELMLIGEELAKSGIDDVFDLFFRNSESRKQFLVAVSQEKSANEVLKILTPLENLNAKNIVDSIKTNAKYLGVSEPLTFENMISSYLSDRKEIYLPSIKIIGNENVGEKNENLEESKSNTEVIIDGYALFKNAKLVGYLNDHDSVGINFINNKISKTILTFKCDDTNYISLEITDSKTSLIVKDALNYEINLKTRSKINEINCLIDLEKNENIKKINNDAKKYLHELIDNSLKSIKNYNTDVLGLENLFYKNFPHKYKSIKGNWYQNYFKNTKFKININLDITEQGNILKVSK